MDGHYEHRGGLRGIKLVPPPAFAPADSDSDDLDDAEGLEDFTAPDKATQAEMEGEGGILFQEHVQGMFHRKDAVSGLQLKPEVAPAMLTRTSTDTDSEYGEEGLVDFLEEEDDVGGDGEGDATGTPTESKTPDAAEEAVAQQFDFEADLQEEWEYLKTLRLVFNRAGISEAHQRDFLLQLRKEVFGNPGQYIVREGETGDKFYIITEGDVIVTRLTKERPPRHKLARCEVPGMYEHIVTEMHPGHFFGERALVQNEPRSASIRVSGRCRRVVVMSISKKRFTPFLTNDPKFKQMIGLLLMEREEHARKRVGARDGGGQSSLNARGGTDVKVTSMWKRQRTKNNQYVYNGWLTRQKIGEGSYGVVYLVQSITDASRIAALKKVSRKKMRKRIGSSGVTDMELLQEVAVMKMLNHNHLVELFEVIDDPAHDEFFIVQEFMQFGPVMMEKEYNEPLEVVLARKYFRESLLGLEYLHFQGVVHRDIKPSNILVGADGNSRLADFGAVGLTEDLETGWVHDVKGTPAFQPPECFDQAAIDKGYSGFAHDVWSLGCTLHTMVVGVPPFMAPNELELVEVLKTQDFRLSRTVALDPHLKNLLERMLTKDPKERITLPAIIDHDWVTQEGTDPMPQVRYTRLNLKGALAELTERMGSPSPPLSRARSTGPRRPLAQSIDSDEPHLSVTTGGAMAGSRPPRRPGRTASMVGGDGGSSPLSRDKAGTASSPTHRRGRARSMSHNRSRSTSGMVTPVLQGVSGGGDEEGLPPLSPSAGRAGGGAVGPLAAIPSLGQDVMGPPARNLSIVSEERMLSDASAAFGSGALGPGGGVTPPGSLARTGGGIAHLPRSISHHDEPASRTPGQATGALSARAEGRVSPILGQPPVPRLSTMRGAHASVSSPRVLESPTRRRAASGSSPHLDLPARPPALTAGSHSTMEQRRRATSSADLSPRRVARRVGSATPGRMSAHVSPRLGPASGGTSGASSRASSVGRSNGNPLAGVRPGTSGGARNRSPPGRLDSLGSSGGSGRLLGSARSRGGGQRVKVKRAARRGNAMDPKTRAAREAEAAAQKRHLRKMRARQLSLLQGHAGVDTSVTEALLDQKRFAFHAARANMIVEDIQLGDEGDEALREHTPHGTQGTHSHLGSDSGPSTLPSVPPGAVRRGMGRSVTVGTSTSTSSGRGGGEPGGPDRKLARQLASQLEALVTQEGQGEESPHSTGQSKPVVEPLSPAARAARARGRTASTGSGDASASAETASRTATKDTGARRRSDASVYSHAVPLDGGDGDLTGLVRGGTHGGDVSDDDVGVDGYVSLGADVQEHRVMVGGTELVGTAALAASRSRHNSVASSAAEGSRGRRASAMTTTEPVQVTDGNLDDVLAGGGGDDAAERGYSMSTDGARMPVRSGIGRRGGGLGSMASIGTTPGLGAGTLRTGPRTLHKTGTWVDHDSSPGRGPSPARPRLASQISDQSGHSRTNTTLSHAVPVSSPSDLGLASTVGGGSTAGRYRHVAATPMTAVHNRSGFFAPSASSTPVTSGSGPSSRSDSSRGTMSRLESERRAKTLQRKTDFVMVSLKVDAATAGGSRQKRVIFQARDESGFSLAGGARTRQDMFSDIDAEAVEEEEEDDDEEAPTAVHSGEDLHSALPTGDAGTGAGGGGLSHLHTAHSHARIMSRGHSDGSSVADGSSGSAGPSTPGASSVGSSPRLRGGSGAAGVAGDVEVGERVRLHSVDEGSESDSSEDYGDVQALSDGEFVDTLDELVEEAGDRGDDADLADLEGDEEAAWATKRSALAATPPRQFAPENWTAMNNTALDEDKSDSVRMLSRHKDPAGTSPAEEEGATSPSEAVGEGKSPPATVYFDAVTLDDDGNPTFTKADLPEGVDEAEEEAMPSRLVFSPAGRNTALNLRFGAAALKGNRITMEDRYIAVPNVARSHLTSLPTEIASGGFPRHGFFAVCDGHNGDATADVLSQILVENIFDHHALITDPVRALTEGCLAADDDILAVQEETGYYSGSTAVTLMVRQQSAAHAPVLYCANVGDSRAVLCRKGAAVALSDDHKCSRPDELSRLEAAGAFLNKGRLMGVLAVSRSFGDVEHKTIKQHCWGQEFSGDTLLAEPEIFSEPVTADDEFVVLACDGVWDVMTNQQVVNYVRRRLLAHGDVQVAADDLVKKAVELNTIDNVTVVIVALNQAFPEAAAAEQ